MICENNKCTTRALFGKTGGPKKHCSLHKKKGEINIACKKCRHTGCIGQAYFGEKHQTPLYCGLHRLGGMTNVVMKKCAYPTCNTRATCGQKDNKASHCRKHSSPDAVIRVIKMCRGEEGQCKRAPQYGEDGGRPLFCISHKRSTDIAVSTPKCETEACAIYSTEERPSAPVYRGTDGKRMCSFCYRSIYPGMNRYNVRIEHFVLAEIQRIFPELTQYITVQDCPIPCGVSLERPDLLFVIGKTLLHIEIDETPDHENTKDRLMRILASTDCVEHIVIRIHTHSYGDFPSMFQTKLLRNSQKVYERREGEFQDRMLIIEKNIKMAIKENKSCVNVLFN